jgi:hypothetical protein
LIKNKIKQVNKKKYLFITLSIKKILDMYFCNKMQQDYQDIVSYQAFFKVERLGENLTEATHIKEDTAAIVLVGFKILYKQD